MDWRTKWHMYRLFEEICRDRTAPFSLLKNPYTTIAENISSLVRRLMETAAYSRILIGMDSPDIIRTRSSLTAAILFLM